MFDSMCVASAVGRVLSTGLNVDLRYFVLANHFCKSPLCDTACQHAILAWLQLTLAAAAVTVQHAATITHAYCATLLLPKQVHHKFCLIVIVLQQMLLMLARQPHAIANGIILQDVADLYVSSHTDALAGCRQMTALLLLSR